MCYRPITIQNPATGEYMKVPCGKCLDCLRKYQNAWSNRMYEEYKAKGFKGVFFTLTYDEAHVPKNYFVDGEVYRSYPDYGFGNVLPSEGFGVPKPTARGVRRKYARAVHSVLADNGLLRDDVFEPNQDVLDFNVKRIPSKHKQFMGHMQTLFADYFALTHRPPETPPEDMPSDSLESFLTIDELSKDVAFHIDEDTGELTPLRSYESPFCSLLDYRERPIISFNSVRKKDVQLWIRRNRTRAVRKNPQFSFSYFITSEYGPRTLRPHYHGVLFGVCADEVRDWFKDWQEHYGEIVTFDDLDPNKGGLSYVSKYCSKGSFEHPLCAKDFFYFRHPAKNLNDVRVSEYHSKHYEKCIQWFGVDFPIVDPTFHLVSNGLGVAWCEDDVIRCKEFEDISIPAKPLHRIEDLLSTDFNIEEHVQAEQRYQSESASFEKWLSQFSKRCCYKRRFKTKEGEKVFAFALPSYYREKMFGRNLRCAFAPFLQSQNDRLYREKLGQVDSDKSPGAMVQEVLALEASERQVLVDNFNARYDKYVKFFNKSQL